MNPLNKKHHQYKHLILQTTLPLIAAKAVFHRYGFQLIITYTINEILITLKLQSSIAHKSGWQCPQCTYENNMASVACEMCQCSRTTNNMEVELLQDKGETSQVIPSGLIRQESKLMENLRQIEEEQALPKWERIIRYCIGVSLIFLFQFKSHLLHKLFLE